MNNSKNFQNFIWLTRIIQKSNTRSPMILPLSKLHSTISLLFYLNFYEAHQRNFVFCRQPYLCKLLELLFKNFYLVWLVLCKIKFFLNLWPLRGQVEIGHHSSFTENLRSVGALWNLLVRIYSELSPKSSLINIAWGRSVKAKSEDVCAEKVKTSEQLHFSTQCAKTLWNTICFVSFNRNIAQLIRVEPLFAICHCSLFVKNV